jgi:hypothetical protein
MSYLAKKEECYFSPEARIAIDNLTQKGLERDLAVEVLHQLWPEEDIYEFPEEES